MVKVIDASVAVKWFVEEDGRDSALAVLEKVLKTPQQFAVPELFYFELANILNRLFPKPSELQSSLLDQLLNIGIARFSMNSELLAGIRDFQGLGLSGYDAAYVALAKSLEGQWLTFDYKAHKSIEKLKLSVFLG